MRIPLARPDLTGNEEKFVLAAVRSSWISSSGAFVDKFEQEFAALCGTNAAVSACNGTVALHLALLALNVRQGDEVLVPSLAFVAVANAVRYVGAEPVFVDVDPSTWCMNPELIEERISPKTRGIIAVHNYGHPADMDAINELAGVHGLWVVEDAAEAHLARYRGRVVGGLGDIGTFSFYGNKIMSCGEGGALTLSNAQLETRIRTLRGQGADPKRRYFFPVTGYNYRLTNVACAILCAQVERVGEMVQQRRAVFDLYREYLDGCPGISFQPEADWAETAPWLFNIVVDPQAFGTDAAGVRHALEMQGIETRPLFIPLHTLPPFRNPPTRHRYDLPVSNTLSQRGVSLPTHSLLGASDVREIADAIRALSVAS